MARGVLRQMVVIMSTISVLLAWTGSGHAISDLLGLDQNPALPVTIDTTLVAPTGRTISVAAGQDLQAALEQRATRRRRLHRLWCHVHRQFRRYPRRTETA